MSLAIFHANRGGTSILSSIALHLDCFRPLTILRTLGHLHKPQSKKDLDGSQVPPYPYGPRQTYHEADRGLYGGAQLQFGNKISKGRNKGKTRRRWYPNVRVETIRSEALDKTMKIKITASCMRTIRKCGGLDQYLLGDKPARIKELGLFGWNLRWQVFNSPSMKAKMIEEKKRLGIQRSPTMSESFEKAKQRKELHEELCAEQADQWEALRQKDERFKRHVETRWRSADKKEWEVERIVPAWNAEVLPEPLSK